MLDQAEDTVSANGLADGSRVRNEVWQLSDELQALIPEGRGTLIRELIVIFKADIPSRLDAAHESLASGDRNRFRAQIHSIKGCARQLGAIAMAALCEETDALDPEAPLWESQCRLEQLTAAYHQAVQAMDAYV